MYISPNYNTPSLKNISFIPSPSFKGGFPPETLTHTNIGNCLEGYIGKVRVRNSSGEDRFLNVYKKYLCEGYENYSVKNDSEELLGEISLTVHKVDPSYCYGTQGDPSHVFVSELRNYSNPNTPFYKNGLEQHKDIGTRLLQIAQRRSDETQCQGNIKLISKNESKDWYKNVIGMVEEFPPEQNYGFKFRLHNSNSMILPPHAKEPLSKLSGGL